MSKFEVNQSWLNSRENSKKTKKKLKKIVSVHVILCVPYALYIAVFFVIMALDTFMGTRDFS